MLIEKIIPVDSKSYLSWRDNFSALGNKIDSQGWIQLFSIWTLTIAGVVVSMDFQDRYVYWQWDGWMIGLLKLAAVSVLFLTYPKRNDIWKAGSTVLKINEALKHLLIGSFLFLIGFIDPIIINEVQNISYLVGGALALLCYMFAFASCLLIFQFTLELDIEKGVWNNFKWDDKPLYLSLSVVFMLISIILGIYLQDPVASTAAAVSIPFPVIALIWPNHVRHLQRARFYPLFTFAMFLCVRAPWFLIPLGILFFLLRTVNYFRYGIVHPSFGVDFLEED